MKEGWVYKKLGDVASFQNGFAFKSSLFRKDGLPIVRISSIQDEKIMEDDLVSFYPSDYDVQFENYKILPNDILIAMSGGTTGKLGINKSNKVFYQNQRVGVIRENKKFLNHLFLFYYLHTKSEESLKIAAGAAQPNLSTAQIKDFIIPLPSLEEQQSIVEYLDSAFAKIDVMKANAEKALNEAKALFQASLKEMLEPKEGWEEKAIKDFATDLYRGSGVKREQVTKEGISCVRYGEIYTKYNYHFNKCDSHTLAKYVNSPKYFEHGDILFAITGESVEEIGKSIAYTGNEKCIAGGDIVVMKHNYEPRFISYALSTPSSVKQKGHGKTKLKVVHTNIPSLKEIIIPIAPINEQIKISDTLDSLKSKVDKLQENFNKISQECDALKQAVLKQVFE